MTQLFHKNHQKPMFIRAEREQLGTESWGVVWLPFFFGVGDGLMTRIPISPSESQVVHGFPIWNPFFVKQPGWNMMIELMILYTLSLSLTAIQKGAVPKESDRLPKYHFSIHSLFIVQHS